MGVWAASKLEHVPNRSPELKSALALASEQGGIITRQQGLLCGLTSKAITYQLATGTWQSVYPPSRAGKRSGVYATFSGSLDRFAYMCAAVLVCGMGATISHDSAAELHGLFDPKEAGAPIHVTAPSGRTITPPTGVILHYSSRLGDSRHPVTLPPRTRIEYTVVDLTQKALSLDAASAIVAQAVQKRLTTHDRIIECINQHKKLRSRHELLEICGDVAAGTHSLLEVRYARRVEKAHRLPRAARQVRCKADGRGYIVDNRYTRYRVRVELDGQRGHTGDGVFRDMWRDNAAALAGDQQLRFGWDDVDLRCCESAAIVGSLLNVPPEECVPGCPAPKRFQELRRRAA